MTAAEGWQALLTPKGLARLAEAQSQLDAGATPLAVNTALRKAGVSPEEASATLTQAELRQKAVRKFGAEFLTGSGGLLFTPAGLEQATRRQVATLHAQRFVAAGCHSVADLGCGIGAESLAFLAAGLTVLPVELDPFTAQLAEHNLAVVAATRHTEAAHVRVGDTERISANDLAADGVDGVFLDPARRTAGHRDTRRVASPQGYSPSLDYAFALANQFPTGIKLGPGFDRELIPDDAEAQWVSVDGQVVETGLWFGATKRNGVGRAALVLTSLGDAYELTAAKDAGDAPTRGLGEYLYEPDGAVIRARLIGQLASDIGAGMLSESIAYLVSDHRVATPFATAFRVMEEVPVKEKELRRALASRDIGTLEIKKRGADVDPAALRKRLKLRGHKHATLFLTRTEGKHVAFLAERCLPLGA